MNRQAVARKPKGTVQASLTERPAKRTFSSPEIQAFLDGIQFDRKKGFAGDWINNLSHIISAMALSAEPGKKGVVNVMLASMAKSFTTYRTFWVTEVSSMAAKMGWTAKERRELEKIPEGTAAQALQTLSVQIGLLMLHPMTAKRWGIFKDAVYDVYLITFGESRAKEIRASLDQIEPPDTK